MFDADGRLASGPIALSEIQGYVFTTKRAAADMAEALDHPQLASHWRYQAERLANQFDATFWSDDFGTYVLALDGMKHPCMVRSSNAGQVLLSGIAPRSRVLVVAEQLMTQEFFSGWGIRTIPRNETRFNPMSYQNGQSGRTTTRSSVSAWLAMV